MYNFDQVLSDEEMAIVINDGCVDDLFSLAERVEKAVVAKLAAEQEPVAWYVPKNEYIRSHFTYDKQMAMTYKHRGIDIKPLYAHPIPCEPHSIEGTKAPRFLKGLISL